MSIKKIIASIAASALAISALPILPIANAAGSKKVDVNITGATFGGWYTDSDCTNAYNFTEAVTSDMTLYAKWTYEVSKYDSDYFKFESKPNDAIIISKVVLDITRGGKTGTATANYSDPITISGGSAVDFYIRITDVPEGTEITRISLY